MYTRYVDTRDQSPIKSKEHSVSGSYTGAHKRLPMLCDIKAKFHLKTFWHSYPSKTTRKFTYMNYASAYSTIFIKKGIVNTNSPFI